MGRREENKARKRAALEDAGLALFVERGFAETSVGLIVEQAHVARGTFYLYFEDKLDLFQHIVRRFLDPLNGALQECARALHEATSTQDPLKAYLALGESVVGQITSHPHHTLLYIREQRAPNAAGAWLLEEADRMEQRVRLLVRDATERGFLRPADEHVVVFSILGALERLAFAFLHGRLKVDPAVVVWEVSRLFGEGLLTGQVSYTELGSAAKPSPPSQTETV